MKRIYEFTVNKEEVVKEESVEKKKDGTEVTTAKEVTKEVPYKFFLRRPTREMTPKKREPPRRKRDLKSWREKLNPREGLLETCSL